MHLSASISMQIRCKKCEYAWEYAGNKHRTSCPKCKTSVTIKGIDRTFHEIEQTLTNKQITNDVKFPYKLWKDARFIQRMQNLPSMGEDYITLKTDINGNLSL